MGRIYLCKDERMSSSFTYKSFVYTFLFISLLQWGIQYIFVLPFFQGKGEIFPVETLQQHSEIDQAERDDWS